MTPEQNAICFAKRKRFLPDARVTGILINADIGPVCWGELHGADRPAGQEFVRFEAVGVDNRNGYDIVQTADGVAYVIVSFAAHAKARGLTLLKNHIAANRDWYMARFAATWD
ncbi:hypothetical protein [Comamonas sp. JUb58]|uniref:hypothetical protein n=1 Tax=Comamonas sp. JUb58 TaxID=2485114 RepID=UPI00105D1696|nr:hypothetical protein [Comamonas sp. JUb58]TDS73437.1 hypothetical protein EDF71_121111 [Comamonas sp. JUb58]